MEKISEERMERLLKRLKDFQEQRKNKRSKDELDSSLPELKMYFED